MKAMKSGSCAKPAHSSTRKSTSFLQYTLLAACAPRANSTAATAATAVRHCCSRASYLPGVCAPYLDSVEAEELQQHARDEREAVDEADVAHGVQADGHALCAAATAARQ